MMKLISRRRFLRFKMLGAIDFITFKYTFPAFFDTVSLWYGVFLDPIPRGQQSPG